MAELDYELRISDARYDMKYQLYYQGKHLHFCSTKWGARWYARKHQAKLRRPKLKPGDVVARW